MMSEREADQLADVAFVFGDEDACHALCLSSCGRGER
jgi:hypothetical protein